MLTDRMKKILGSAKAAGWVMEPGAKAIFLEAGLPVARFTLAKTPEEAVTFAKKVGYPVVAKIVSPNVMHKSDVGGVVTGIRSDEEMKKAFQHLRGIEGFEGVLVDETVTGVELIMGAKNDAQFGPVVLLGIGGTGVEIYNDVAIRMAPLEERDVEDMIRCLKGRELLLGYRGQSAIDLEGLTEILLTFSNLVMDMATYFESIDVNPLMCSAVIADARIILKSREGDVRS